MIKDWWLKRLAKFNGQNTGPLTPDEMKTLLRGIIVNTAMSAMQKLPHQQDGSGRMHPGWGNMLVEAAEKTADETLASDRYDLGRLLSTYQLIVNQRNHLANERKQETWADLFDRASSLAFRMLTALGIAAVVLLTGYLAQTWRIPLPMLRLL